MRFLLVAILMALLEGPLQAQIIKYNSPISGSVAAKSEALYIVQGKEGDVVHVLVQSANPTGSLEVSMQAPAELLNGPAIVSPFAKRRPYRLKGTGPSRLIIENYSGEAQELKLAVIHPESLPKSEILIDECHDGTFAGPGDLAVVSFQNTEPAYVLIDVQARGDSPTEAPRVNLYAPKAVDPSAIANGRRNAPGRSLVLLEEVGVYQLLLDDLEGAVGGFRVCLSYVGEKIDLGEGFLAEESATIGASASSSFQFAVAKEETWTLDLLNFSGHLIGDLRGPDYSFETIRLDSGGDRATLSTLRSGSYLLTLRNPGTSDVSGVLLFTGRRERRGARNEGRASLWILFGGAVGAGVFASLKRARDRFVFAEHDTFYSFLIGVGACAVVALLGEGVLLLASDAWVQILRASGSVVVGGIVGFFAPLLFLKVVVKA